MKRNNSILLIFQLAVYFLMQSSVGALAQPDGRHFYEAEAARNNGLILLEDSAASCGKYLRMRDSGSVLWNVMADTSAWHELTLRYRTFGSDKEEYIVRNGYQYAVGFGRSEDWNSHKTRTFLQKGANEITLKGSWGNIDIDYLDIAPVTVAPAIKPLHNIFYRESPRDIFFKINRFGHQIKSVTCGQRFLRFDLSEFPAYEDAVMLRIAQEEISKLENGKNELQINFNEDYSGKISILLTDKADQAGLTIIAPDIDHGASVLMILPSNKVLLVDCGKDRMRDSILIPLLHRLKIDTIHYFMITHYHEDHDSGDKGKKILDNFHVNKFWDYNSFRTGDEFDFDGTRIKILNSYEDGEEENTRSLSFKMEYNGFVYVHGGDTYHTNQQRIMKRFPNDIEAEVFMANHHFHGSVDVDYLCKLNPVIVLLQAQRAIYARSAYMERFKKETEGYLIENKKRYIEDLPALEVGTVIVRIYSKNNWTYETNKTGTENIPFLFK